jgi:hypothetical protein
MHTRVTSFSARVSAALARASSASVRSLAALAIALLLPCASWSVEAAEESWTLDDCPLDMAVLQAGKMQVCEKSFDVADGEGQKKGVMGVILIKAPYKRVWRVISDWPAQADFVPGLEYFKVRHVFPGGDKSHWHALIEGKLDIPFAAFTYTVDAQFDRRVGKMTWKMLTPTDIRRYQAEKIPVVLTDEERLRNVEGLGQIVARDDGSTVYYYAPVIETTVPVPAFIESAILSVSLNDYMEAIRQRAETAPAP